MPTADRILMLKLLGDTASIDKSLKKTQGRLRSTAGAAGGWLKAAGIGLAIEGVSRLTEALGDAWTGFRDGEKASGQLGTTWGNLNVKGADLQGTIDQIGRMALKLGTDDTEAINAFNTALQMTGGKPAQAMNRLRIAQDLVANGSAPNLQSAMKLIDRAASGSASTVRKFGLTSDTAAGRVKELGEKVKGAAKAAAKADPIRVALNGIGEGLETFVGALSKGDLEGALGGVQAIGAALATAWSSVFPAIDKAMTALVGEENWNNAKNLAQGFLDSMATIFEKLGTIWDGLAPHVQNAANLIAPWVGALGTVIGLFAENVMLVLDAIGDLLNGDFTGAWENVQKIVGNAVAAAGALLSGFLAVLSGIIPGVVTAAQGIGQALYDGIVTLAQSMATAVGEVVGGMLGFLSDIVDTVATVAGSLGTAIYDGIMGGIDTLAGAVRGVINQIIGALNSINDFAWERQGFEVNTMFGNAFVGVDAGSIQLWPDIAPLAKGGIVMPRPGGTLAQIAEAGKPEAVIPLDRMGDMGGGNTYVINVNIAPGGDLAEAGRRIVKAIREYERSDGKVWRTA